MYTLYMYVVLHIYTCRQQNPYNIMCKAKQVIGLSNTHINQLAECVVGSNHT